MNKSDEYSSLMLRFRRMYKDNQPTWVVFVQTIQTGQVVCFPRLSGLIKFLESRFGDIIELEAASLDLEVDPKETESGSLPPEG